MWYADERVTTEPYDTIPSSGISAVCGTVSPANSNVREDIHCKQLKHIFPEGIEGMFVELNFRKCKWLLFGTYHSPSQNDAFFNSVGRAIETYNTYDKLLLAGDFNADDNETILHNFMELYNFSNLVKDKTCFKSLLNPTNKLQQIISTYKRSLYWIIRLS